MYEPSDLCFEDHLMCLQDVKGFPGRRMTAVEKESKELPGKPFILLGLMGRAHNQMSPSPGFLAALWELNHESALH